MGDNEFTLPAGESVRWRGRPGKFLVLRGFDLPVLIITTLGALGFLAGVVGAVWTQSIFMITGPAGALGLLFLGPFQLFRRARELRATEYLLTDRRVLAVCTAGGRLRTWQLTLGPEDPDPRLARSSRSGQRSGTVVFGRDGDHWLPFGFSPYTEKPLVLHEIEYPEQVCGLIVAAWHARSGPAGAAW
ncbi:hypothetical protein [Crossiella cryophila]|uniref:Uncharacterized protein n=1 Tax=Crossiella cryophila TaxID=43355 RepID=A0A7W7CJM0_9PSEU|nr:hypothetical protein [Crossiella cryophila]MBB4680986.1 hypothetical protein [Crossiella cryophila]